MALMSKKGRKKQPVEGEDLEGLDDELGDNVEGSDASDEEDITQDSMIKVRFVMVG